MLVWNHAMLCDYICPSLIPPPTIYQQLISISLTGLYWNSPPVTMSSAPVSPNSTELDQVFKPSFTTPRTPPTARVGLASRHDGSGPLQAESGHLQEGPGKGCLRSKPSLGRPEAVCVEDRPRPDHLGHLHDEGSHYLELEPKPVLHNGGSNQLEPRIGHSFSDHLEQDPVPGHGDTGNLALEPGPIQHNGGKNLQPDPRFGHFYYGNLTQEPRPGQPNSGKNLQPEPIFGHGYNGNLEQKLSLTGDCDSCPEEPILSSLLNGSLASEPTAAGHQVDVNHLETRGSSGEYWKLTELDEERRDLEVEVHNKGKDFFRHSL